MPTLYADAVPGCSRIHGSFLYLPRDTKHSFVVESPVARFLTLCIPANLEAFMDELSEPA